MEHVTPHYLSVPELLEAIPEPNRTIALELREVLTSEMPTAKGSSNNHQAREGGYYGHIQDAMNLAKVTYEKWNALRPLPFTLGDVQLVIFLHDLEKPFTYADHTFEKYKHLKDYDLRDQVIKDRGFKLTDEHWNGLEYIHGEGSDHKKNERVQRELAAFCHIIDTASARIRFDHPKEKKW